MSLVTLLPQYDNRAAEVKKRLSCLSVRLAPAFRMLGIDPVSEEDRYVQAAE
jgi:hypothetical protein